MTSSPPLLTERFSILAPRYDAVLSDIWGVIHNGVAAFADACDALVRMRSKGGAVVLISNAPRPSSVVRRQLKKLGVPPNAYDDVITSGDVAQHTLAARAGGRVFHIGPERDLANFEGIDVRIGPLEDADYVVCTGLFDDTTETPADYRALLADIRGRSLFMVCANPDLVVERGDHLVYCAGAIADLYKEMGGSVLYTGKPHRPIYDEALAKIAEIRGGAAPLSRVLAIGDSVRTDLAGAAGIGIDCLFVTGGIHAKEIGRGSGQNPAVLAAMFADAGVSPAAVTPRLVW